MTDVELVERAELSAEWRRPCGERPDSGCRGCRAAALWQTLDGLRGLNADVDIGAGKWADGWDSMAESAKLRAERAAKGGDRD